MVNFTQNNHLSYSIGGRNFGSRENGIEKYQVTLGKIDFDEYKKTSWRQELRKTADSVLREFGKDLVVFLSGGTDSEIVARNFLEIGVKPKCAVIRFKDGYNDYDVSEAEEISRELGLDLIHLDFDVKDFYHSGRAAELAAQIQCCQITYLTVYENIKRLSAPAIMGGELFLSKKIQRNNKFWYYVFRENEDASAMRFSNHYNIPLVNEWFSYTPEMILHFLNNSGIKSLISDRTPHKLTSVSVKNDILKTLFPDIRKKIKTHGFERLRSFNFESYNGLENQCLIKRTEGSLDGIPIEKVFKILRNEHENY
jgi:hypothetical protein